MYIEYVDIYRAEVRDTLPRSVCNFSDGVVGELYDCRQRDLDGRSNLSPRVAYLSDQEQGPRV